MISTGSAINTSLLPPPNAIEPLDFQTLYDAYRNRLLTQWDTERANNGALPEYNVAYLETDPAGIVGEAWSYLRLLDRQRVNDAFRSLLAAFASGADLDAIASNRNIERLVIVPETADTPAIMEGDAALLRRYLLSFDKPSSGSVGRYLYDAWTAWPQSEDRMQGLWDARVNGRAVHGRRGDTDVVISGPFGREPTPEELSSVRALVTHPNRAPEAVAITVLSANRNEYSVNLTLELASSGVSPSVIVDEAQKRIVSAATARTTINGEIPVGYLIGAAFGDGILRVRDNAPVHILPDPYTVPVMVSSTINYEVS